ncbi:MAG: hypothetical protein JWP51_1873 [Bradyrhizobium sp.]|nr:hypothetical protein [Bradyrhizobium sp.]
MHASRDTAQCRELIDASRAYPAGALHSVLLKCLAACPAKSFTVLLEALLDGVIAFRQLISAKPRRIARASLPLLRRALSGLRSRIATSQNQRGNCYQNKSAHCFLRGDCSLLQISFVIGVCRTASAPADASQAATFQAATASRLTSRLASWVSRASARFSSSRLRCSIFCSSRRPSWPASAAAVPYAAIS